MEQKIAGLMLSALCKYADKEKKLPQDMAITLELDAAGDLICKVVVTKTGAFYQASLSDLIGGFYAMMGKSTIKKMLVGLEKEMHVTRGGLKVVIMTDGKLVSIVASAGQVNKQLTADELKKLM